jgi:aminopeptidase N
MPRRIACLLPALLLALPLIALAATPPDLETEISEALSHRAEEAANKVRLMEKWSLIEADKTANQDLYDVHHYDLTMDLNPTTNTLTGTGLTSVTVTGGPMLTLDLNLDSGMTVSACRVGGASTTFSHVSNIVTVNLDRSYVIGETVTVEVDYSGDPAGSYFGWSSYGGSDMIWTLSEPYGAREWWPCKDLNTDKADSVDVRVTVPDHLIVASNGLLLSDIDNGATRTFHWKTRYALVPYLVSLAIHPYEQFSTWYTPLGGGDPMEIQHFVYADQLSSALTAYDSTDEMIGVFANAFGEYPFVEEKYGHASFTWGGGMEHQTITSMGGLWEDVISHELGHQWWGDMITCSDFSHIWLNEGFATWCEAYWKEQTAGVSTYKAYMDGAAYYGGGTIYVTDVNNIGAIFNSNLSYNKGSWIVHMLRGVLGDTDFFAGLAAYQVQYGYASATTEQFRDVLEGVSGMDLDAFFQQWIYGEYFPVYAPTWVQNGGTLELQIDQTHVNAGVFTMPIDVQIVTDTGTFDTVVQNNQASQMFNIPVTGIVQSVTIDPDDWILSQIETTVSNPSLHRGVLVVNGVDWGTYTPEIQSAYEDSVFWGSHPMEFWDTFAEPVGGYPANLPTPLGHGSVPAATLGQFSAVVWVGNNYNGDLAKWQESPIKSYLDAGGNVLLLGRHLHDFLDTDLTSHLGVTWTVEDDQLSGDLSAVATGLIDIASIGTQSWLDAFSTTVGAETTLLMTGTIGGTTSGMGAIVEPAAGGAVRSDGARLAVISGRPYRYDHTSLRANVDYILSNHFSEPYNPTTAIDQVTLPSRPVLGANYPNPFNPQTVIPMALPVTGRVDLAVYDAAGRRVRTLISGVVAAGEQKVTWDGRNDAGRALASGTYFARLRTAGVNEVRPLVLVR